MVVEEGMECFIVDYEWYGVRGESERRKGIERGVLIRMGIKRGEIWEFIMGGWAFYIVNTGTLFGVSCRVSRVYGGLLPFWEVSRV